MDALGGAGNHTHVLITGLCFLIVTCPADNAFRVALISGRPCL